MFAILPIFCLVKILTQTNMLNSKQIVLERKGEMYRNIKNKLF